MLLYPLRDVPWAAIIVLAIVGWLASCTCPFATMAIFRLVCLHICVQLILLENSSIEHHNNIKEYEQTHEEKNI